MKKILIFSIGLFLSCTNNANKPIDKSKLLGVDYRLFEDTPVWNLAKAVQSENIEEITKIVKEEKVDINYQESKFGQTLLFLTIKNEHYNSCKTLLELGADPNIHDKYNGSSAIIEAAGTIITENDNARFLILLLKHGANPNDVELGLKDSITNSKRTPLINACGLLNLGFTPINRVKVLIDAGADINFSNQFNGPPILTAYSISNFDVVSYLLQKGADYKMPFYNRNNKDVFLWDDLREQTYPLDSKQYKYKMEIVEFLKQKGIDYRKLPIPSSVVNDAKETYPNNWKEYLDKY
jgi:ankyrin repeat protein